MSNFRYLGRLSGGPEAYYSGVTDLTVGLDAAGARLYAITRDGGGLSAFGLKDGPEAPSLLSQAGFGGQVAPLRVPGLSMLDTGAGPVLQPTGLLAGGQSAHWLTAAGIGARVSASGAQAPADLLALVQVVAGGRAYAVGSRAGEEAPRLYALGADGGLTEADGRLADRAGPGAAELTGLAPLTVDGTALVLGVSPAGNAVTSYRITPEGRLDQTARLESIASGTGFDTPDRVATVTLGGAAYAVLGGAGSSSLTVLRIGAEGGMTVTDHVVDSLDTRFQGVTALETFTLGERVFVLAGGADDGLSLLALTPAGRLIHLRSLADTAAATLDNVSAIAAAEVGGTARIFAASETEPGISRFSFDPGGPGQSLSGDAPLIEGTAGADLLTAGAGTERMSGGAGDDLLIADGTGTGVLRLAGGAGADVFVAMPGGRPLRIEGFEAGVDRLDLSLLPMLRNLGQLDIARTREGAVLSHGDTRIELRAQDGGPIPEGAFTHADLLGLTRFAPPPEPETLGGTGADDRLALSAPGGRLDGLEGADVLSAGTCWGDVTVYGGAGDDVIELGAGGDFAAGGADNDLIRAVSGRNTIYTGLGRDEVQGGTGRDVVIGAGGPNRLFGNDGDGCGGAMRATCWRAARATTRSTAAAGWMSSTLASATISPGRGRATTW